MSATGDLIAALVAGGMNAAEAAGLVARAAVEMTGAITRKSSAAVRQQRYRERNKASQSVTQCVENEKPERNETPQTVTPLRSVQTSQTVTNRNESVTRYDASLSKEEKKEEIRKEKREGARGSRLPESWEPPRPDWEAAIALLGANRADDELAKFRDHWKAQPGSKGVKADWPATFRNWYRRANDYGNRNGQSVSNHRTDPATGRATAREARHVSTMGSAALRYLEEGKSAGQVREATGRSGITEAFDLGGVAKNAH